jgi:hypothetical protein
MNRIWPPTDPNTDLIAYWIVVVLLGAAIVVVGYRTDRKQVPFSWDRYWHWWRVCVLYGMLGAVGVIPAAWLLYFGHPPHWVGDVAGAFFLLLVFGIPGVHWRLWVPIFGAGLPRRVYLSQAARSFGYSISLTLAGTIVLFVAGSALAAR